MANITSLPIMLDAATSSHATAKHTGDSVRRAIRKLTILGGRRGHLTLTPRCPRAIITYQAITPHTSMQYQTQTQPDTCGNHAPQPNSTSIINRRQARTPRPTSLSPTANTTVPSSPIHIHDVLPPSLPPSSGPTPQPASVRVLARVHAFLAPAELEGPGKASLTPVGNDPRTEAATNPTRIRQPRTGTTDDNERSPGVAALHEDARAAKRQDGTRRDETRKREETHPPSR